ncbi:hypothetical protein ACLHZ6_10595, partial [Aeromonas rivipollensis]
SSEEVMDFKCDELILGKKDADSRALTLKSLPLPSDVPDYHLNCVWHPVHAQQLALIWLKALMKELVSPQ